MHRSLIPGTGSSPTRTPSAESTSTLRDGVEVFFFAALRVAFLLTAFLAAFFFAMAYSSSFGSSARTSVCSVGRFCWTIFHTT